jgi:hypothetical protein
MKRSKEEAEVIVRLDFLEQSAHVCVSQWPAMAAKMEKLYGKSLDGNSEMSRRWVIPMRSVSFRRLRPAGVRVSASRTQSDTIKASLPGVAEQQGAF